MTEPLVTIVVVPRERFSYAVRSLENILRHTDDIPSSLVYVDGGSPGHVRRYLVERAQQHNFKLIRKNQYLSPNQARNLGLQQVKSKYVVFIDNDVLVTPGWLAALVACAEKTGAWVVGPLYLLGKPGSETIHMAGGLANIGEEQGKRAFYFEHCFSGKRLDDIGPSLHAQATELAEFHCMLLLTEACRRLGPFDEQLLSMHEHEDLCLTVREMGGTVYFEPDSIIIYVPPPPFAWSDLPFFMLRWSEAWNSASRGHFQNKWRLQKNDKSVLLESQWAEDHRRIPLRLVRGAARRLCRFSGLRPDRIDQAILLPLERRLNRYLVQAVSANNQNGADPTVMPTR